MLTTEDLRKAGKQATGVVADALGQVRTPLYAVLGAGDLATEAVRDYVAKARYEADGPARAGQTMDGQARTSDLQTRLAELQERLVEVRTQIRARVDELPEEVAELRGKLESGELRQALESYLQSLQELYERLAVRGEQTVDKLRPQVKKAIDRVEEVADVTEDRVGKLVEDARELTYEVLGRLSRRTRSVGEQAADQVERTTDRFADVVDTISEELVETGETSETGTGPKATATTRPTKPAARKNGAPRKVGTKA